MPVIHGLLKIEDLVDLDERQQALLTSVVANEIRTNPEIAKILRARAEQALKAIKSARKPGKK